MTQLQKLIIGFNLIILMAYTIFCYKPKFHAEAFIPHAIMIGYHLIAIIFAGVIAHALKKADIAKAFGLSLGVVLLVGFGTCVYFNN